MFVLPLWLHQAFLVLMFVLETIVPWGLLLPSFTARVGAAALTAVLQVAIALVGNYGCFNVLSLLLCGPSALNCYGPAPNLPISVLQYLYVVVVVVGGGLVHFHSTSYCTNTWLFQRQKLWHLKWLEKVL